MTIKKFAAVGVLAIASLAIAGSASASASPAPYPDASTLTCSTTQVTPNQTFTCTVTKLTGPPTSDHAQLSTNFSGGDATIAGLVQFEKPLSGNVANFTVTAPAVLGNISITSGVGPAGGPFTATPQGATVAVVASLASTGTDGTPIAIAAGTLLAGGAAAVAFGAYRRRVNS